MGPGTWVLGAVPRPVSQSRTQDSRPRTQDPRPGPRTQDPGLKTQDPRPRTQDPGLNDDRHPQSVAPGGPTAQGRLETYTAGNVHPDMSFLEMLDVVNEDLIRKGEEPIAFDSDCREGICGSCGLVIDGVPHGPDPGATTCQVHMRRFKNGDTITIEPFRARAFPVIRTWSSIGARSTASCRRWLRLDERRRRADGNAIPVPKDVADLAMDNAQCIGCGAASPPARTRRPTCSPRPRSPTSGCCPRASRALPPGRADGGTDGRGGFRQLLERRRVRGGVPEGNLDRQHRPHEP